ncbi:RdRP-domain-containing protein [Dichomitus squalens LYAD-421 SS1]|uniref:RdRP-domain-containing protein n=1 Tax=Dichomitus squalens (strain LYAD-421) TaxID=732165 RepID=UPI0004415C25|nr:RdRP-domain-containing protein [Dichomitus squalens LYAD-421 SS1]EJF66614.1 RdRP-domain-containing protein [Dichomitus squalens LYAD-421 SS1]
MDSEVYTSNVAFGTSVHELKAELAKVLHAPPFLSPTTASKFNFEVHLFPSKRKGASQSAALTLPTEELANQFLHWYGRPSPQLSLYLGSSRIQFQKSHKTARPEVVERIRTLPYEEPRVSYARERESERLRDSSVRVTTIQFGRECRDHVYSVEWEKICDAHIVFDEDRREFRVKVRGDDLDDTRIIAIRASQIAWVSTSIHQPSGSPVIFFSLDYPPSFETESVLAPLSTSNLSHTTPRQRWTAFDESHEAIAPYTSLAIRLECASEEDLGTFRSFARAVHTPVSSYSYPIERRELFTARRRELYELWLAGLPWMVAFHLEALVRSWLVDMTEILLLRRPIDRILRDRPLGYTVERQREYVAALLRELRARAKELYWYGEDQHRSSDGVMTQPPLRSSIGIAELFEQVRVQFVHKPLTSFAAGDTSAPFNCLRLTVTPTTMILEGPFPERSNRVMRKYYHSQDCFLRVSFQDENRLQYRFNREVDGRRFIDLRVKRVLLEGIRIAGAHFRFLAYSQSALKEHAVWFVKPFRYRDSHQNVHFVDATTIIQSLGQFHNLPFDPTLMRCPARYAARISQAFTATDAAVSMAVGVVYMGRDIKGRNGKDVFTDGVGTLSPMLAESIWKALQSRSGKTRKGKTYPRAFQVRFQGSKGMLSVDYKLTDNAIMLRPSMIKFDDSKSAIVEVARAFDRPGAYYLNRPLIMLLEGLGVPYTTFKKLQDDAVRDAQTSVTSLKLSAKLFEDHGLGVSFRIAPVMLGLHKLGLGPLDDDIFWRQMMDFAVNHVLRELKHRARIPVPGTDSWTLVGVADIHRELKEGEIFVCVDSPKEKGLIFLEGPCVVSRSPTIHPGDVQIATAIGRPRPGSHYDVESLRNTVVFSTTGSRPLPSCLGGGDLDGDEYNVTTRPDLMPKRTYDPASYEPAPRKMVDHESTMDDVAEFVAEFISSDTLGIIATNWLITADQTNDTDGILNPDCLRLAELHSLAVDYAKTGQPVPIEQIPRPPLRIKPDWNAPETHSGKNSLSFYRSMTAVGKLFRAIDLPAVQTAERAVRFQRRYMNQEDQLADVQNQFAYTKVPRDNVVARTVQRRVSEFISTNTHDDMTIKDIWELYNSYISQLRAICADFTLSPSRSAMISEEEVVVGTIVAKCSQRRKRKDQMSQMREQTATLVDSMQCGIAGDDGVASDQSLYRAWVAYRIAIMEHNAFGARSFAWIALSSIFDAIKDIEVEERTTSRR